MKLASFFLNNFSSVHKYHMCLRFLFMVCSELNTHFQNEGIGSALSVIFSGQ